MATAAKFIEMSGESLFILQCTVQKVNGSNVESIKPDETTAVLKVDEVFRAPEILGNLKGKLITVKLTQGSAKAKQQFILMARPWQYSNAVAVVETERMVSRVRAADFRLEITNAHLSVLDQQLENRIASAVLIVSGKVIDVEKIRSREIHTIQDREEDWYEATILVKSVEKGKLGKVPEVKVRFPGLDSEKRYAAPRFMKDQEGVWLLHTGREKTREKGRSAESYLEAPDPMDFHLLNQLSRIRALVQRSK